ncbi:hypothetical protein [Clostridium sp. JS66]|uniref:hypothetical protein n=1 Tax=Clostridium sp. JS66 TaxID=3064705 RepID=UPI00298E5036|nr:hypothetical protein [Clostridium sp. JS66]WPC42801.1 hypothetical protein Q6H37_04850 [Clostridium sp. JS66]
MGCSKENKIMNNNIVITEVEDRTGQYTHEGVEVQNAILQGEASGRYNMAVEIGFKALEMLEMVLLETGLNIEELMYLKNK